MSSRIPDTESYVLQKKGIKNTAILASAGTGKTWQLAMRYINLLLNGAKPDEIVAATFSKKAAAEIFEKIVSQLLLLIAHPEERMKFTEQGVFSKPFAAEDFMDVLRQLLSTRKRLHIETNDSFLMQIIQSAPSEFGIYGEISLILESDDRPRQRAILQTIHSQELAGSDAACAQERQNLYMILRDCSFGKEKATLYSEITTLLKERYRNYLDYPDASSWTLPGEDDTRLNGLLSPEEAAELHDSMLKLASTEEYMPLSANRNLFQHFKKLADAAEKAASDVPVRPDTEPVKFFINDSRDLFSGPEEIITISYSRNTYVIEKKMLSLIRKMIRHLLAAEYRAVKARTDGVYRLMRLFDASCGRLTRNAGKLTFGDIIYLLNKKEKNDFGAMQVLRERLGLHIDHYLLDEFQDTSTAQWNAFRDLVEDVIQSEDPERFTSFFMVGDIKQSIYQWRQGNPDLFGKICREQHFLSEERMQDLQKLEENAPFHGIIKNLFCSFRSTVPVLQMVNDVFAPEKDVSFPHRLNGSLSQFLEQREKMAFHPHRSGLKASDGPERGCAMLFEMKKKEKDSEESDPDITASLICRLIRKLDPFSPRRKKPLSVAVLFRWNKSIHSCYESMRRLAPELDISMEGTLTLSDSMVCVVFCHFLQLAAHPGDPASSALLSMLRSDTLKGKENEISERLYPGESVPLPERIRQELDADGYFSFFRHFRAAFPEVEKEKEYADLLESVLSEQEREEHLSVDELLTFLDTCESHRSSLDRTVQLMTIHQSKGLGFDIVIVPDDPSSGGHPDNFMADEESGHLYFKPAAPVLFGFPLAAANEEKNREKACYEKCCNLYVALTRAKRGLYVFVPPEEPGSKAATLQPSDILRASLTVPDPEKRDLSGAALLFSGIFVNEKGDADANVLYCTGDPFWADAEPSGIQTGKAPENRMEQAASDERDFLKTLPTIPEARPVRTARMRIDLPSPSHDDFAFLFADGDGADFGTRVHCCLSRLEWLRNEEDVRNFLLDCHSEDPDVAGLLESAFSSPEILRELQCPSASAVRLYREQPFLLRHSGPEGGFLKGIVDRAVVEYDGSGIPLRATVLDYKTDRDMTREKCRERYRRQLEVYRTAVAAWTGLPAERVRCVVLALRCGIAASWQEVPV